MQKPKLVAGLFAIAVAGAMALVAQGATPGSHDALEIVPFEVPEGVNLPADFQSALAKNLVKQIDDTHKFSHVFLKGEGASEASLRLTGTITTFKKGNRFERYMVPGVGKTVLKAHVQFVDVASGTVKLEKDVEGQVILGGAYHGDSIGATNGLAKDVAKAAKNTF